MISIFPSPYPDELLYSVIARYKRWMGYRRDKDVFDDLFCVEINSLSILWHMGLGDLKENVPRNWWAGSQYLISNHTLLPILEAFSKYRNQKDYWPEDGRTIQRCGFAKLQEKKRRLTGLAYCPKCSHEDYLQFGETFWRRAHNINGVFVCADHKVFLRRVPMSRRQDNCGILLPPKQEDIPVLMEAVDLANSEHRFLLYLAQDLRLMLNMDDRKEIKENIAKGIFEGVQNLGLTYKGRPRVAEVKKLLTKSFDMELLAAVDFPQSRKEGITSWCHSFKDNSRHIEPAAAIIALYVVGRRPSDVLSGGVSTDSKCSRNTQIIECTEEIDYLTLPIGGLLKRKIEKPIGLPKKVLSWVYDSSWISHQMGKGIGWNAKEKIKVGSDDMRRAKLIDSIEFLKSQPKRITWSVLSAHIGSWHVSLKSFLECRPSMKSVVEDSLETPMEFAKRKVRLTLNISADKKERLSVLDVVKMTNTHVYYSELKPYIEKRLNAQKCDN